MGAGINARFWTVMHGNDVKITLRPGQTLNWGFTRPTEEGYTGEFETWTMNY